MSVEHPWNRTVAEPTESMSLDLDPETWLRLQGTMNELFPTTVNPEQFPATVNPEQFPATVNPEQFPATVNPEQYPLTVGGYPADEGPAWWSQIEEWTPETIKKLQEKYKDDKVEHHH